jgi:hypothetical protein
VKLICALSADAEAHLTPLRLSTPLTMATATKIQLWPQFSLVSALCKCLMSAGVMFVVMRSYHCMRVLKAVGTLGNTGAQQYSGTLLL